MAFNKSTSMSLVPLIALAAQARTTGFPYGSATFTAFVEDSYRLAGKDPATFYRQADSKLKAVTNLTWNEFLEPHRKAIDNAKNTSERVNAERHLGRSLHRVVKKLLPNYSLEQGFEFANMIQNGQRQCLLQSVLIASLMQKAGVQAGVVVVWKRGAKASNNGHNCVLVKLSNGHDILVDASEPEPFAQPVGLFSLTLSGSYRYVEPRYSQDHTITAYKHADTGRPLALGDFLPLDTAFVRSEFDYYRGERAPQGIFAKHPTREGLALSERFLKRSSEACPRNPLTLYMLGTAQRKLGRERTAAQNLQQAERLYFAYGHLPEGPRRAIKN